MIRVFKLNDVDALAKELSTRISHPIVLFDGSMGMGKTTLIKALCKQLNVVDTVSSPTFSLINEYKTKDDKSIYHFDCYRLETPEEAYDFGAEEYLECLVPLSLGRPKSGSITPTRGSVLPIWDPSGDLKSMKIS
jgi:tRNA threonylcarbamoyladenosine biosynthesis protein TsaE